MMKLNAHKKGVVDLKTWKKECPPKESYQWKDKRSAKLLAEYITTNLPQVPIEIEKALSSIVDTNAVFDWDAEYVTALPGRGEGRNHDAVFFNEDILVSIEAKVDEPLGDLISEQIKGATVNKLHRISEMLGFIFKDGFSEYGNLRYQLLTASVGTLLEAKERKVEKAVLLVLIFKTEGESDDEKLKGNSNDIAQFLKATNAKDEDGLKVIPNNTDIKLYFKEIVI